MYIGYVQFLMIGLVFLEAYKDTYLGKLIFDNFIYSLPILFVLFIFSSIILGKIDTFLGLREEELRNSSQSNPVTREILSNIEEIKKEIKSLKEIKKE